MNFQFLQEILSEVTENWEADAASSRMYRFIDQLHIQYTLYSLKGPCQEIFHLWFFSSNNSI
jgi:hypothetical protein